MWRSLFLALGTTLVILGLECLVVKKAVLAKEIPVESPPPSRFDFATGMAARSEPQMTNKVVEPPEWAPWSLLSGGAVVLMYGRSMQKA